MNSTRLQVAFGSLLVVLALLAIYQMSRFNEMFERRIFLSPPAKIGVVPLTNNRFAVVDGSSISVYQVDKEGYLNRLSDTDVAGEILQKNRRNQ